MINPALVKRTEEFVFLHVAIIHCTHAAPLSPPAPLDADLPRDPPNLAAGRSSARFGRRSRGATCPKLGIQSPQIALFICKN